MNNDPSDLEVARLLLQAIRNEPRCDDPTCCPPPKEQPVTALKAAVALWALAVVALLCVLIAFGQVLG